MKNNKFLLMTLAASTFLLASCFESEAQNDAAQNEAAPAANAQSSITGVYCQKADDKNTNLAIREENTGDLRFSFSVWNNTTGHNCGTVNAIARSQGGGNWLYQSEEQGSECTITITAQDVLTLTQGAGACREICGMRGSIGQVSLPESTKIGTEVSDADLSGLYETPICP